MLHIKFTTPGPMHISMICRTAQRLKQFTYMQVPRLVTELELMS